MKVRKLAVALAVAGGLGSGLAHALGMGEGRILTNLNEPLRAEIEVSEPGDLSVDQIKVSLAPDSEFERAGLRRMDVLHRLEFEVVESDSGFQIDVTSDGPIREPFLNFLVELTWPNGRLLREYSFLVDPPSRSADQQAIGPGSAGVSSDTDSAQQRRSEVERERSTRSSGTAGNGGPREYGPTGANDTLWGIAGEVAPSGDLNRHQVMLAIQEANPDAFANNNINELRRGRVLRIPSEEQMRSRSGQEAIQQVKAQNERHQQHRSAQRSEAGPDAEADAPRPASESASSAPEQERTTASSEQGDDELRILVADDGNGDEGATAGMGDGEGNERLTAALEELDRAQRDREELSERLADLEEQLNTMSQLIELKDDQLAEMEQRLAEARRNAGDTGDTAGKADTGDTQSTADGAATESETSDNQGAPEEESAAEETDDPESQEERTGDSESDVAAPSDQGEQPSEDEETDSAAGVAGSDGPEDGDPVSEPEPDQEQDPEQTASTDTEEQGAPTSLSEVFQRVINDPRYQIGAGALGIGLLALLWGLARRNAAREQAFYEQLKDVSETGGEADDDEEVLSFDEPGEESTTAAAADDSGAKQDGSGADDALAEADVYLAYGRHGQAVQHLEDAISSEPSRVDLRLKLLEVYADAGEPENFEKQYRELSAFEDSEAMRGADELRSRLETSGDNLSLDELTEQLKTGSESVEAEAQEEDDDFDFSALEEADDLLSEESGSDATSDVATAEDDSDDFSIDYDIGESDGEKNSVTPETETRSETEDDVADLGFSMDDLELEEPVQSDEQKTVDEEAIPELDVTSDADQGDAGIESDASVETDDVPVESSGAPDPIALDDVELESETDHAPTEAETEARTEAPAATDFDDSFLEELDAELDRVTEAEADESVEPEASAPSGEAADELDDLSLDVSEEDLELADEVAQEGVGDEPEAPAAEGESTEQESSSDSLEESLVDSDMEDLGIESTLSDEELAALEGDDTGLTQGAEEGESAEVGSDSEASSTGEGDDEFDFLEGTDESGTKLDLARAYVEMGDADGAREILDEVTREGSEEQQQEAQRLLSDL